MDVYIVKGDDWAGLYIDGELRDEGHSLDLITVLEIVKADGGVIDNFDWDYLGENAMAKLGDVGRFPEKKVLLDKWLALDAENADE